MKQDENRIKGKGKDKQKSEREINERMKRKENLWNNGARNHTTWNGGWFQDEW